MSNNCAWGWVAPIQQLPEDKKAVLLCILDSGETLYGIGHLDRSRGWIVYHSDSFLAPGWSVEWWSNIQEPPPF